MKGIGFVKACQIKAAFELSKRVASYCEEEHPVIASIDDVVKLLAPHMQFLKQEEFRVILLDSKKRLINHQRMSLGSLNASLVEPREVFRPALTTGAKYIILVHNHPSGDSEDEMRKKTKEYQIFALKDIFSEYELKGYTNGIEKIVQKNSENKKPNF